MDVDKLVAAGERMGLSGKELQAYVDKKEAEYYDRQERYSRREEERAQREEERLAREADRRALELQEAKEKREFELLCLKEETERAEKKRLMELEEAEKKRAFEIEVLRIKADSGALKGPDSSKTLRPKLPKFEESKDDMDAYLERFERFAKSQNWTPETWAVSLSSLLTGKGLEVYTSMPPDQADNYDELKKAVLKRYQLTEEGFRSKFRECMPERGETVFQFMARLDRYFGRWTEMAEIPNSFEGIRDLMIREQFIQTCSTQLALFLKERKATSRDELVRYAEQYIEAHGGSITSRPSKSNAQNVQKSRPLVSKPPTNTQEPLKCYICLKTGHKAKDCYSNQDRRKSGGNQGRPDRSKFDHDSTPKNWREKQSPKDGEKKAAGACLVEEVKTDPLAGSVEGNKVKLSNGQYIDFVAGSCLLNKDKRNLTLQKGYVGQHEVQVLRDTGCEHAVVKRDFITDDQILDKTFKIIMLDCTSQVVPVAKIQVDTPYYTGEIEAMVLKTSFCDLALGNLPGVALTPNKKWMPREDRLPTETPQKVTAALTTRAQAAKEKRPIKPLKVPGVTGSEINAEQLKKLQTEDQGLANLWRHAHEKKLFQSRAGYRYMYEVKKGVLFKVVSSKKGDEKYDSKQIVVPTKLRTRVMSLAHEAIVGGHLSSKKTCDRIETRFFWPGLAGDVARFCRSCDICQKVIAKGRVKKVPLGSMPIMETPFHRVAVDLIGPIDPISEKGNRYILTIVDYATRYPEAVPLPKIETERVAEALLDVFSRVGFPAEILSDNGSQFTSEMMHEVSRLTSMRQLFTTPYNPKCSGLCERINGVLKNMLKKMCQEKPRDWDRYISAVLFAYREVPQASTGFSPFELLYGRTVRGPLQILKELWTEEEAPETRNTYEYVLDLRNRLEETCKIARESLHEAQKVYKHHYDKKARTRVLEKGDKVLVLLPTRHNKLQLQWRGPFEVIEVLNKMDYKINIGNKVKTFHINLLKKYEEREDLVAGGAIIEPESSLEIGVIDDENLLQLPDTCTTESYKDVQINSTLDMAWQRQLQSLVHEYQDIFTEEPGTTSFEVHEVDLLTSDPIRVKQYPLPYAKREAVNEEVVNMLKMGVIEPATSEYNSPVVLVKKKDNSNRFCVDFRRINAVTKFDTEPMSNDEDIRSLLHDDKFFSKLDLSKGYWQIPVAEKSRKYTAFSTPNGSYQFRKMPFGMVNSGATFNRMMRKLLAGCKNADNYVDDILGHTKCWEDHIAMLREVFQRVRNANLTIRPSKCLLGFESIPFTGHVVGEGKCHMEDDKLWKIQQAEPPKTKTQVRSFLGLTGYYRKFIPSYAEIATPLTNLTKKGMPNKVIWLEEHDVAFRKLKAQLVKDPILRLPDLSKTFILQCDASETGVGAALLQQHDDGIFPVAYASKKLLKREQNYSVIERECLALVFGVKKFQKYLYGKEFVIMLLLPISRPKR